MVEFSLVAPLLLLVLVLTVDFARLIYTYSAISSAAREGARLVSLRPQQSSDCLALQRMVDVGKGFPLQVDPNSIIADSDPNSPSGALQPASPPPGVGYVYIWPAVATAAPQLPTACGGGTRQFPTGKVHDVSVQITYHFTPFTPLVSQFITDFNIKTVSVVQTEGY